MWYATKRGEVTESMMPSNIGYSFREAGVHIRRNWSTCLGAVVTIFLSLFVIGVFALGSNLLSNLVGNVENRVTIQVFLSDDAKKEAVEAYQAKIEKWDNVDTVTYKSKEEALQEYRETMSNRNAEDAVAALDGQNPVPASLVINLDDPKQVESVANKIIKDKTDLKVEKSWKNQDGSDADWPEDIEKITVQLQKKVEGETEFTNVEDGEVDLVASKPSHTFQRLPLITEDGKHFYDS